MIEFDQQNVTVIGAGTAAVKAPRSLQLRDKKHSPSIASNEIETAVQQTSLEEHLFDRRISLKLDLSRVAMHLSDRWRKSLFSQIDMLHSMDDWEEDSSEVNSLGFRTLLRFIVFSAPQKLPGLAIAPSGNPVGSWAQGALRAHVEFLASDLASAVLQKPTERGPEAAAWRGPVTNLRAFVVGFGCGECFGWANGEAKKEA